MVRTDCPCDDNPLCPSEAGERVCSLCGFDFKAQYLSREDLAAARAQAAQRGLSAALAQTLSKLTASPVTAPPPAQATASHSDDLKDFEVFRDFPEGPEMVVLPAGQFMMGSPKGEGRSDEHPQHLVSIAYRFAAGKYPVTFDEWDAYRQEVFGCHLDDKGWGRGRRPVINVFWEDAQAYIKWLNQKTGKTYRLLSEAEWEYAARAGTSTAYSTGKTLTTTQANFASFKSIFLRFWGLLCKGTTEVDNFAPNSWGLHDMHGNVWEWVQDAWMETYVGAPLMAAPGRWMTVLCGGACFAADRGTTSRTSRALPAATSTPSILKIGATTLAFGSPGRSCNVVEEITLWFFTSYPVKIEAEGE